ncbi:hypothetical protein RAC89_25650 [Paenibacillus sp. GD4]|uniref:hypothetical protein n=1 Tax=Paenibacillus sp. GD4 TaxID=3068890 RepID=UPI00279655CF|nr:hypothetical protein [Paenibacillus sp. GD4]MDQ1913792.1 hypothetical protein [Paenibacillus sp. GD4]
MSPGDLIMTMKYNYHSVSQMVGFYRKHQRVPSETEVLAAVEQAKNGDIRGAALLLDWSRHCFFVKTDSERMVMEQIQALLKQFMVRSHES